MLLRVSSSWGIVIIISPKYASLKNLARWFAFKVSTIQEEDRVLGEQYVNCKPFTSKWDNVEVMPQTVQQQRKPRHLKKILGQWYNCALRPQSDAVRALYRQVLVQVTKEEGKHLWKNLACDIIIDSSLTEYPKVIGTEKEAKNAAKQRANKRRADAQGGPAANTPISVARKRKGCKHDTEKDEMHDADSDSDPDMDESETDKSAMEIMKPQV